jgi:putative transcriptional regulator
MTFDDSSTSALRGQLLLADPSLRSDPFTRSVLLVTEHRPESGAHGYVLNRPMHQKVGDFLPVVSLEPLAEVPVFCGGPVEPEQLTFASLAWDAEHQVLRWETHLDTAEALARRAMGASVRGFLGYSGWASGQLESELKRRSWITCPPSADVTREAGHGSLWMDLMSAMGPFYRMIAQSPEDPSLN